MTIQPDNIIRIRALEEANGSFAVDGTGTLGNYKDLPVIEGTPALVLDEPSESPKTAKQYLYGYDKEELLPKSAKLDFGMNLTTVDTKATTGVTIAQSPLGLLLSIGLGGEYLGTGTTVDDAGATTTVITLADASGFTPGGAVGFATGANGELEIREIDSISSETITLKYALSSAPANSSTAYGAATYFYGNNDGGAVTSLQALAEGAELDDRWYLAGGQLSAPPTLELPVGGIPKLAFSWLFAQWFYADGSDQTADLTASALANASYVNRVPVVLKDSEFRVFTVGTTAIAGTLIAAPSFTFAPAIQYAAHKSPGGVNTISQWVPIRGEAPPVAGNFTVPYEDQAWFTARSGRTNHAVGLQIGTSVAVGGVLISAPTVQIKNPNRTNLDGIAGQTVEWIGRNDEEVDTPGNIEIRNSPLRIHMV